MTYRFWTTVDQQGLATLPTSNYRTVVGIRLASFCVLVAMAAFVYEDVREHHDAAETILGYTYTFLGAMIGIGTVAYGVKRATDRETKVQVAQAQAQGPPTAVAAAPGSQAVAQSPAPPPPPDLESKGATQTQREDDSE